MKFLVKSATLAAMVVVALSFSPARVRADIVGADFNESLNLPDYRSGLPRILQNLGVALPSAQPQLTAANTIANPSGWNNVLNVGFDATTNILSLTGDGFNTYQTITVTLNNLQLANGEYVTGITPLVTGMAVTQDSGPLSIGTAFTDNSFSVNYSVPIGTGDIFDINAATDTYLVSLGVRSVPEPSSVILLGGGALGFAGLAWKRRRKSQG